MGCCESKLEAEISEVKEENKAQNHHSTPPLYQAPSPVPPPTAAAAAVPSFSEFSLTDLKAATNNFSSEFIVSESGDKAPNLVYKGRLQNRRWIAVKKFKKLAWPDPKQFAV